MFIYHIIQVVLKPLADQNKNRIFSRHGRIRQGLHSLSEKGFRVPHSAFLFLEETIVAKTCLYFGLKKLIHGNNVFHEKRASGEREECVRLVYFFKWLFQFKNLPKAANSYRSCSSRRKEREQEQLIYVYKRFILWNKLQSIAVINWMVYSA